MQLCQFTCREPGKKTTNTVDTGWYEDAVSDSPSGISHRVTGFFKNTIFESRIYRRFSDMFGYNWLNKKKDEEPEIEDRDVEIAEDSTHQANRLRDFRNESCTKKSLFHTYSEPHSNSLAERRAIDFQKVEHIPFSLSRDNPFLKRNSLFYPAESNLSGRTNVIIPVPVVKTKTKTAKKIFKSNSTIFKRTKSSLNGHNSSSQNKSYLHSERTYVNKYLSTAQQSIRLEERERYKQLLQQYTATPLNGNSNSSLMSSRSSSLSSFSEIDNNPSKDASTKSSGIRSPVNKSILGRDYSDQLRRRLFVLSETYKLCHHSNFESIHEKRPDMTPIIIDVGSSSASSKTQSDDEIEIIESEIQERKVSSGPVISTKDKLKAKARDCVFLSSEWTSELKKELERKSSELKPLIEIAEIETVALRKEREDQNKLYRERLRQRFQKIHQLSYHEIEEIKSEPEKAFIELTEEMETCIDEALTPYPPDEMLVEGFNVSIRRRDIETLSKLNWLNDEIMNFYFNLLVDRGKQHNCPSVYAFNTFFYPKLMNGGHRALKRWTRKVDIFSYQFILIPVHLGMHWCLAVIDFKQKEIRYYDSLGNKNNECLKALREYICDESFDKKKQEFDTSVWSLICPKDIPQQMNGSDCGMFACIYAEYITREAEITFTQEDMPYFRRRMVYEILTKELL
ncbi:Sentrin-specific protease 1 [Nymphon striatum]|nr:Sentrin-specific protease 1 [Nymphon striatum]